MASPTVPRSLHDITPDWLTTALGSVCATAGATVACYSAEAIAEGTGFVNRIFRLRLAYDVANPALPNTIIVKLPPLDPTLREVADRLGHHRREIGFYQELATNPHLPAPRHYYARHDPIARDTALLLEDMGHARQGDSVRGCSFDEARQAMVQLARFQASWWDRTAQGLPDWMPSKDSEIALYQDLYPGAWESLKEKAGRGLPHGLRKLGDRLRPEIPGIKSELATSPRTVLHGDFRLDNCFFAPEASAVRLVVFDWEFCVQGRGACDAATFISEAFPVEQRRKVESALLRAYHSVLVDNGVADYSFEQCWHDYRLAMLEIFVFWIITGGYCNYESARGTLYLHGVLERLDAAISDLASIELVAR